MSRFESSRAHHDFVRVFSPQSSCLRVLGDGLLSPETSGAKAPGDVPALTPGLKPRPPKKNFASRSPWGERKRFVLA
jgi:hypothetical protein